MHIVLYVLEIILCTVDWMAFCIDSSIKSWKTIELNVYTSLSMRTEIGCVESKVGLIISLCVCIWDMLSIIVTKVQLCRGFSLQCLFGLCICLNMSTEGRWRSVFQYANVCLNIRKYSLCMHMRFHVPAEIILSKWCLIKCSTMYL